MILFKHNFRHQYMSKQYSLLKEKLNVLSHAFGLLLSIVALVLILNNPLLNTSVLHTFSFGIFAVSLIILYAASTFYHRATDPLKRARLRVFDHASIYVLIAGTYTPFTLIALNSDIGWKMFITTWLMAIAGVTFKLFFTGRFSIISTLIYVCMGGMVLFFYDALKATLPEQGLTWVSIGGLSYVVGAIIYSIKVIKLNHAIFHLFVLLGSFSHFISIYFYIV